VDTIPCLSWVYGSLRMVSLTLTLILILITLNLTLINNVVIRRMIDKHTYKLYTREGQALFLSAFFLYIVLFCLVFLYFSPFTLILSYLAFLAVDPVLWFSCLLLSGCRFRPVLSQDCLVWFMPWLTHMHIETTRKSDDNDNEWHVEEANHDVTVWLLRLVASIEDGFWILLTHPCLVKSYWAGVMVRIRIRIRVRV
jgi:hypothetical protein